MGFKKGEKNPGKKFSKDYQPENAGRPKKLPNLDTLLADVVGEDGYKEIIEALIEEAKSGKGSNKTRAAEILLDRGYGKAKQAVDITSVGESIVPTIIIKQTNAD